MSDARVHWNLRVWAEAKADAEAEAVRESQRSGERWTMARVGREWLKLGREAWFAARSGEGKI